VGTGSTDEDLASIPLEAKKHKSDQKHPRVNSLMDADVWFTPYLVIEVIGDELTLSPIHTAAYNKIRHESGLAIRFPRFTRLREDKGPEEVTSIKELVDMYNSQLKGL
jgi:DNA ligase-1